MRAHPLTSFYLPYSFINNADEFRLILDKEFRLLMANEDVITTLRQLHGPYNRDCSVFDWIELKEKDQYSTILSKVLKGAVQVFTAYFSAISEIDLYTVKLEPFFDIDGNLEQIVLTAKKFIDYTRAKNNQILEEENRSIPSTNGAGQYFWEWNFTNEEFIINEYYAAILGWDTSIKKDFKDWCSHIHPVDRENIVNLFSDSINNLDKDQFENDYRILQKDGKYVAVTDKVIILRDNDGKISKIIDVINNIYEPCENENQLIDQNQRYNTLRQLSSEIVWDWDLLSGELTFSDSYNVFLGWILPANNKLPEKEAFLRYHPEDQRKVQERLQEIINNPHNSGWEEEYRYLKADGSYINIKEKGCVLRNEEGKVYHIVGVFQDISVFKNESQLLSLEAKIFQLAADATVPLNNIIVTLLEKFECIHPPVVTCFLYVKEDGNVELISTNSLPYEVKSSIDLSLLAQGKDFWSKTMEQENCFGSYYSCTVLGDAGELLGCVLFFQNDHVSHNEKESRVFERIRDLVKRVILQNRSIQEMKKANERFEVMMKASKDLIWDWDLESGTVYRDIEGVSKVYGITEETTINNINEWISRIHPGDRIKMQKIIKRILNAPDENSFELEYRFLREDGTYAYVYDRGTLLRDKKGKPYRMIGSAHDITERKKLEKELIDKELEKQRAINQATIDTQEQERTEIAKELHDNVNQVLTTTKLYLELATSNPEMKDQLIEKSTKNVIYVINEIRQLSRSLMNPSLGDLGLIDALRDLAENIHFTKKLHLNLDLDEKIDSLLDENQKVMIFRISQEILNNTIKHAQATTVDVKLSKIDNQMELMIRDDGKGFDILKVKKGAGLKNIQNRVYLAGGTLEIQSKLGFGATTIIKCPVKNNL